jgi:hypothetical protein
LFLGHAPRRRSDLKPTQKRRQAVVQHFAVVKIRRTGQGGEVKVHLHPHAQERLAERGATEADVIATVVGGGSSPAKFGRVSFRRHFSFQSHWRGKHYATKQITAFAAPAPDGWLVITVIVKYF